MREFARAWSMCETSEEMLQQPAATLPWGHHMILLDKIKDVAERTWYFAEGEYSAILGGNKIKLSTTYGVSP
jgi:hypothetical protein